MAVTGTENGVAVGTDRVLHACEKHWPADQPPARVLVRAPGRLDCMGGMADYSGALALQMPVERGVHAFAGPRDDQAVYIESIGWNGDGEPSSFQWPLAWLYQSDGQFVRGGAFASHFEICPWVRHAAGVFLALLESGDVPHYGGGVNILFHSDLPAGVGLASSAAIEVATAKALTALFDVELSAQQIARACRCANLEVVGDEPGLVDHLTCLLGEPGSLLQIRCQPDDVLGRLSLPKDVTFAGVHVGTRLAIYRERYASNRAAAMIGRFLVEKILQASGGVDDPTAGYLANVSPNEYVRRFRNELPVKLRGQVFLEHFGQPEALEVTVAPEQVYKVRSRTEHHIYENDRTHRLLERLARARRTGERDALIEAGELMYASHWSYSQRCGVGSIETDALVNAIRQRGPARGLYGAKTTGGGCGGTVAVLMADSSTARAALEEAAAAFAAKTGQAASILIGSSPGAMHFGQRALS